MWNSRPVRILWHSFNWLTRIAIVGAVAGMILLALSIIGLRYWFLPDIEQYHEQITQSLSRAIGRTVTIEKIAGDWQGLRPRLSLVNLSMLDEKAAGPGVAACKCERVMVVFALGGIAFCQSGD